MMGSLLIEYLGSPQQDIAVSKSNSEVSATGKSEDIVDSTQNNGENMDSSTQKNDDGESPQLTDISVDYPSCASDEIKGKSDDRFSKELVGGHDEYSETVGKKNCEEASLVNEESIDKKTADCLENSKTCQDCSSISNNVVFAAAACQFKNVVAIVDPPRVGLHPTVSTFQSFIFLS